MTPPLQPTSSITEFAFLPFPQQTLLHDLTTSAGHAWARILDAVRHAPGHRSSRWGYQIDRADVQLVWFIVEWASIAHHEAYEVSPECAAINASLFPMLAPSPPAMQPHMFHVRLVPPELWEQGVMKLFTLRLASDQELREAERWFEQIVEHLERRIGRQEVEGMHSVSAGWVEGKLQVLDGRGDCKGFVIACGWGDRRDFEKGQMAVTEKVRMEIEPLESSVEESVVLLVRDNGPELENESKT